MKDGHSLLKLRLSKSLTIRFKSTSLQHFVEMQWNISPK